MHQILKSLHEDHVNLLKLLTMVRRELQEPTHDGDVDYNLIVDVLDYVENYSETIHHAREDQLYARLKEAHPEHASLVERLFGEHQRLKQTTLSAVSLMSDVLNDVILDKHTVDKSVVDYLNEQTEHMREEELTVFPLVDSVFEPADWEYVTTQIRASDDPLFGVQVKDRYRSLYTLLSTMH